MSNPIAAYQWIIMNFAPYMDSDLTQLSYFSNIKVSFFETFSPDDEDALKTKSNQDVELKDKIKNQYSKNDILLGVSCFFGIPNHMNKNQLTGQLILKNIVGIPCDFSVTGEFSFSTFFYLLKAPLHLLLNAVCILLKTIKNIFSLIFEYVPLVVANIFQIFACQLITNLNDSRLGWQKRLMFGVLLVSSVSLYYLFCGLHLMMRAVLSPLLSMGSAWRNGRLLPGWAGWVARSMLVILSVSVTIVSYSILFPLGIKLLALYAPPIIIKSASVLLAKLSHCSKMEWFVKPNLRVGGVFSNILGLSFTSNANLLNGILTAYCAKFMVKSAVCRLSKNTICKFFKNTISNLKEGSKKIKQYTMINSHSFFSYPKKSDLSLAIVKNPKSFEKVCL